MTPPQEVQAKAATYLLGKRVRLIHADADYFRADVRGSDTYAVEHNGYQSEWTCTCPARTTCCHIVACQAFWSPVERPAVPGDCLCDLVLADQETHDA